MKLWIIGHGLLGTALKKLCDNKSIKTVITTRDVVDITHLEQLKKFSQTPAAEGVTHIINCAAYTNVDQAEKEPELAHRVNALGPENIGNVANKIQAKVVHISTDYVFGEGGKRPFKELDTCNPVGVYGKTKWEGEVNLLDICPLACIIRSSWLFGRGGKNFISSLVQRMKSDPMLHIVNDQKGRPTFVQDLAEAILSLLCHGGIYHFSNAGEVSRYEMAQKIHAAIKTLQIPIACTTLIPVSSDTFPTLAKRPSYSVLCTEKITSVLGTPPRHWEEALKEYLRDCLRIKLLSNFGFF